MRLFAAVLPPAAVLDDLDAALAGVRDRPDAPRWARRDAQHITLAFFGEVPESRAAALTQALAAVPGPATVHLRLGGAGTFPERGSPRVLWVGVDGDVEQLARLARDARRAARKVGVPVEGRRPYRPHLTVGRWRPADPADRSVVGVLDGYRGPSFTVDQWALVRSRLGPRPAYETLASWDGTPGDAVGTRRPTSRRSPSYQA